jgi:hypothetical protein
VNRAAQNCTHLMHTPKGICLGCREQHQPLPGYSDGELEQLEREFWADGLALAAGTQSAETNEDSAQSEGCQSGPKGNAQRTASHD